MLRLAKASIPFVKLYTQSRALASACGASMKYLNVAEKNDAAKTIAGLLSRGSSQRREGYSPYNKIYEFNYNLQGQNIQMVMTSVSGHLLNYEFLPSFRGWQSCNPEDLFDAPVRKNCPEQYEKIKKTLEREVRGCSALIIWTDCDREGENIGFEIIEVCRAVKPQLRVLRAKFSEITAPSIKRAIENLVQPDARQNEAVNVRSELDLRIGAAFTRFQTLRLQKTFPQDISNNLVSYGSCQIPTLGFVAQRYKEIENFIPQTFWKIKLTHTINELTVEFHWSRNRLFDKQCCEAYLMLCQNNPIAKVVNVTQKPKNKWRPNPMDTVELEKLGSRKLKMNAKQVMTIAEKLYTQGIISYPRTETNIFTSDMKLAPLVQAQVGSDQWGSFAEKVLQWGINPRNGKKSDQAHPPIHPTKLPTNLSGDEWRVYELIARHFLACISRDATGSETIVNVIVGEEEEFTASGLCIHERNYLEVYPYDRWNAKEIHAYQVGHTFEPTELGLHEGSTTAPNMLTEADLIALMEKHGIGTDATHAEHINTIKERGYIGERDRGFLVPGTLGMGLVEGYEMMELRLAHPELRAGLEADLKLVCEGRKNPAEVLSEQIAKYKEVYRIMSQKARALDRALGQRLNQTPRDPPPDDDVSGGGGGGAVAAGAAAQPMKEVCKCPKCGNKMCLRSKRDSSGYYLGCIAFPECRNNVWFDDAIREINAIDDTCARCGSKKIVVKFRSVRFYALLQSTDMDEYRFCIVCDDKFRNLFNINESSVRVLSAASARMPSNVGSAVPAGPTILPAGSWGSGSLTERRTTQTSNTTTTSSGTGRSNTNTSGSSSWGTGGQSGTNASNWGGSQSSKRGGGSSSTWGKPINNRNDGTGHMSNGFTDSNPSRQNSWKRTPNTTRVGGDGGDEVDIMCRCGTPASRFTVKKDGPNKGRPFFSCPNQASSCGFFKWGDENMPPAMSANASMAGGGGAGAGSISWGSGGVNTSGSSWGHSSNDNANKTTKTVRKCGICRQEGHTKNKCPQRGDSTDY
ncbi:DNA topoisomerase 3-alpha [Anopheles maculipalpis]|uniref:DNA topoisomerase 3-alpha n=1 Tax=Anopheles maculipalpis TaxID=1496333 RepID=UPI00215976EC|nr:DNA topoisomerase 3-alpha [Anopheles maculipalpis]